MVAELGMRDDSLDEVIQARPSLLDELWIKVVSKYPLSWNLQVQRRKLFLQRIIELVELCVSSEDEPLVSAHTHHHLVNRVALLLVSLLVVAGDADVGAAGGVLHFGEGGEAFIKVIPGEVTQHTRLFCSFSGARD